MSAYPGEATRPRAVLVRGIPGLASEADVDEFFSFCGAIESKRLSTVPPLTSDGQPTLEAIVVFSDEASRRTALLMHESSILDTPVAITAVPDDYVAPDANSMRQAQRSATGTAPDSFGALFSGVSGLFAGVGETLSGEMARAGAMLDAATETGVLKTARDQAALARRKTAELIQSVDEQYAVGERAGAVAGAVSQQTRTVATAVAEQSKSLAAEVDSKLHLTQNTRALGERAMQNEALSSGVKSFRSGLDSLLSQTGLMPTTPAQNGNASTAQGSNGSVPPTSSTAPTSTSS